MNKVGIGNDDNLYIYVNARFKVGSAVDRESGEQGMHKNEPVEAASRPICELDGRTRTK